MSTSLKYQLTIFLFTFIFFLSALRVNAQSDQSQRVLFINQVRGGECCDPGNLEHLKLQLDTFEKNDLPANFAIRYDALTDPRYVQLLKQYSTSQPNNQSTNQPANELGIFLEITPSLIEKSGGEYKGTNENWYQAQYAYPIGYEPEMREKLVDTVFAEFFKQFGKYPKFTVGWIVDTPTINYMREKYGVTTHEITREQWGTDSYTLDGGPIHYPYYTNPNWAFLPRQTNLIESSLPLGEKPGTPGSEGINLATNEPMNKSTLMLRQTISDPLFNYGDSTSAFTSQPNDYSRDGKNFEYFKNVLNQSLSQSSNPYSFAILGLENSMEEKYQDEFVKQIEYVKQLQEEKPTLLTTTVSSFQEEFSQLNQPITVVQGKDLINQSDTEAIWVNASKYRVRILKKDAEIKITDLRIYDENWTDPYTSYSAQNLGYWVAPFVVAGSRFYETSEPVNLPWQHKLKDNVKEILLPEYKYRPPETLETKNDTATIPTSIDLPDIKSNENVKLERVASDTAKLSYLDAQQQPITFTFFPDYFEVQTPSEIRLNVLHDSLPFFELNTVKVNNNRSVDMIFWEKEPFFFRYDIDCEGKPYTCKFLTTLPINSIETARTTFYPYLFPEVIDRPLSNEQTVLYAHNKYAIAGRNPVRFVLIPKDEQGYATTQEVIPEISTEPEVLDTTIQDQQGNGVIFMDVIENRVGKYQVKVKAGDQIEKEETVYFAPDCSENIKHCMTHPNHAVWFLMSSFYARLRVM